MRLVYKKEHGHRMKQDSTYNLPLQIYTSQTAGTSHTMCTYTEVEYGCHHVRYTVRTWCPSYETTHRRCPPRVVAVEFRIDKQCGDCCPNNLNPSWMVHMATNKKTRHAEN